jgi:hypothetical protein
MGTDEAPRKTVRNHGIRPPRKQRLATQPFGGELLPEIRSAHPPAASGCKKVTSSESIPKRPDRAAEIFDSLFSTRVTIKRHQRTSF